ncbi:MAG: ABC transporter ATP-binding protein [Acetobacteraceae bacterium]
MIPYLELRGLAKQYGEAPPAVTDFTLSVEKGEFITFLGPSGCGKTTILRIIAGLVQPSAGRIFAQGADITARPTHLRNMGLVFQNYALFPHLSVERNLSFGLEMRGLRGPAARERVAQALALVQLTGLGARKPKALSGGQQQRVALARALVIEPSVLLLDEPLSNLDAKLREELRDEIRDIQRRLGITAIFVTHDQVEALTMSDRVAIMHRGRVEQVGSPREIYEYPATPFVAGFIGRTNRIPATVETVTADQSIVVAGGQRFSIPMRLPEGARVTAMIRPHRMRISEAPEFPRPGLNGLKASINRITFAGEAITYEADLAGIKLAVETQTGARGVISHQPGDLVWVEWPADETLIFEPA